MTPEQVNAMLRGSGSRPASAERCVWGSDWPHTKVDGHMSDDGKLPTPLRKWVADATAFRRILLEAVRCLS
jgi:predicted TIM-barrel fold metal-dependent hydrolase